MGPLVIIAPSRRANVDEVFVSGYKFVHVIVEKEDRESFTVKHAAKHNTRVKKDKLTRRTIMDMNNLPKYILYIVEKYTRTYVRMKYISPAKKPESSRLWGILNQKLI